MKKKILCLAAAFLLLLGIGPVPQARAEEYTGGKDWSVQFTGNELASNFKSSDLSDEVHAIQPGDRVTVTLTLKNRTGSGADWYMTNQVIKSLEDSQRVADGGAYTYELTYITPKGEKKVLYSSANVGGEKTSAAGEGLHEVSDSLKEFFYLDRLEGGQTAHIELSVSLDGESQGNTYQDTLAELQMNFAVEKVPEPEHEKPKPVKTPSTGDTSHVVAWSAAALVCGLVLILLVVLRMKKKPNDGKKGGHRDE